MRIQYSSDHVFRLYEVYFESFGFLINTKTIFIVAEQNKFSYGIALASYRFTNLETSFHFMKAFGSSLYENFDNFAHEFAI